MSGAAAAKLNLPSGAAFMDRRASAAAAHPPQQMTMQDNGDHTASGSQQQHTSAPPRATTTPPPLPSAASFMDGDHRALYMNSYSNSPTPAAASGVAGPITAVASGRTSPLGAVRTAFRKSMRNARVAASATSLCNTEGRDYNDQDEQQMFTGLLRSLQYRKSHQARHTQQHEQEQELVADAGPAANAAMPILPFSEESDGITTSSSGSASAAHSNSIGILSPARQISEEIRLALRQRSSRSRPGLRRQYHRPAVPADEITCVPHRNSGIDSQQTSYSNISTSSSNIHRISGLTNDISIMSSRPLTPTNSSMEEQHHILAQASGGHLMYQDPRVENQFLPLPTGTILTQQRPPVVVQGAILETTSPLPPPPTRLSCASLEDTALLQALEISRQEVDRREMEQYLEFQRLQELSTAEAEAAMQQRETHNETLNYVLKLSQREEAERERQRQLREEEELQRVIRLSEQEREMEARQAKLQELALAQAEAERQLAQARELAQFQLQAQMQAQLEHQQQEQWPAHQRLAQPSKIPDQQDLWMERVRKQTELQVEKEARFKREHGLKGAPESVSRTFKTAELQPSPNARNATTSELIRPESPMDFGAATAAFLMPNQAQQINVSEVFRGSSSPRDQAMENNHPRQTFQSLLQGAVDCNDHDLSVDSRGLEDDSLGALQFVLQRQRQCEEAMLLEAARKRSSSVLQSNTHQRQQLMAMGQRMDQQADGRLGGSMTDAFGGQYSSDAMHTGEKYCGPHQLGSIQGHTVQEERGFVQHGDSHQQRLGAYKTPETNGNLNLENEAELEALEMEALEMALRMSLLDGS